MADPVNHPEHYTSHPSGFECFDVIRYLPVTFGNLIKYLWRMELKGGLQDYEKALWYLQQIDPVDIQLVRNIPDTARMWKYIDKVLDWERQPYGLLGTGLCAVRAIKEDSCDYRDIYELEAALEWVIDKMKATSPKGKK